MEIGKIWIGKYYVKDDVLHIPITIEIDGVKYPKVLRIDLKAMVEGWRRVLYSGF